jgi:hypothetical protein
VLAAAVCARIALWLQRDGPLWFEEDLPLQLGYALRGIEPGHLDLDPRYPAWPHLSIYFFYAAQLLQFGVGRAAGIYSSLADFRAAAALDPTHLRAVAMLAAMLVSLLTLWATARLAARWVTPGVAPWVAAALALDSVSLRYSLVISPDMLLTLFVVLALLAAWDVEQHGRMGASVRAGVWLGLGAACKYSPLLAGFSLLWAHARRPGGARGPWVLADRHLLVAAATAVASFVAASPFTFRDVAQQGALGLGARTFAEEHLGMPTLSGALQYATIIHPGSLGWPLWAAVVAGVTWTMFRSPTRHGSLLAFLVPYLAVFGAISKAPPRYVLPVLPVALVLTTAAAWHAWQVPQLRRWLVLAGALAVLGLVDRCGAFLTTQLRPDSRALARTWILSHVPDGAAVATEYLGPPLPSRRVFAEIGTRPGVSDRRRARLERGPAYWLHTIPFSPRMPEATTPFYNPSLYVAFDRVVTSSGVRGRFLREPQRFPRHADFYQALDGFFLQDYRTPHRGSVGPTITVYRPVPERRDEIAAWWARHVVPLPTKSAGWAPGRVAEVFASRAQIMLVTGRAPESEIEWRRALEWPPAPAGWWLQYGLSAQAAGDWPTALSAFAAALARDSSLVEAALQQAATAGRLRRWREARVVLEPLIARVDLGTDDRARALRLLELIGRFEARERRARRP